ncbi:GNAT family N-acetyltransferase [Vibrio mediterranei]|uniref:GNAT family N-acetyltransferase n=1 Tax=Vibrio mediterranei TaxID=689 RepID=A0A3G4VIZ6_9VIBR|nr:GNAT family N-acetyltransferase [Vibrio mediterranei]AYV22901.1 GNAT family N-acetyltransferase [Vibrio mediterranei]
MTDLAYRIRSANTQDLETLNDLMYELHEYHHQAVPEDFKPASEVQEEKSIARYLDSPDCLVLVLTIDGDKCAPQIVGFVTAQFCELLSPISKPCLIGNIDELFIKPDYRHHGFAQKLLKESERRLIELGASQIMVEVWDFNHAALNLYNKEGFIPHIHCLRKKI